MSGMPPIGPISNVSTIGTVTPATPGNAGPAKTTSGFTDVISKLVDNASQQIQSADQAIDKLSSGETEDFQSVIMSMAKADLSFRFILEIRNKLMDAYQEIMRMQV